MSFSSVGRRFHARGAATENARRSPICRSVRGRKRSRFLEARSDERAGIMATGVSRSVMYYSQCQSVTTSTIVKRRWHWSVSVKRCYTKYLGFNFFVKPRFHYTRVDGPSYRPELTGDRFPLPVNTASGNRGPVNTARNGNRSPVNSGC